MTPKYTITLAILAGGKALRLGGVNKALIKIDGETIISKTARTLSSLCHETIIIAPSNQTSYGIPAKIFPDLIPDCGPIGGIHSALRNATYEFVLVASCDMPFINPQIAKYIVDEFISAQPDADIAIPTINGFNEPLLGIYKKGVGEIISKILSDRQGHPISELLNKSKTHRIPIPPTPENLISFTNINTLKDIQKAKGIL